MECGHKLVYFRLEENDDIMKIYPGTPVFGNARNRKLRKSYECKERVAAGKEREERSEQTEE